MKIFKHKGWLDLDEEELEDMEESPDLGDAAMSLLRYLPGLKLSI